MFPDVIGMRGACIGIIGCGGKTSMLYHLGEEFSEVFEHVIVTSRTRMESRPNHRWVTPEQTESSGSDRVDPHIVLGPVDAEGKHEGISELALRALKSKADLIIFECDGARGLSLKAYKERDAGVPAFTTHTIIIVGADVVETSISDGRVHRPELFKDLWSLEDTQVMSADFIAQVVLSQEGLSRGIPAQCHRLYFVNKADKYEEAAGDLSLAIRSRTDDPVFYGSLQNKFIRS